VKSTIHMTSLTNRLLCGAAMFLIATSGIVSAQAKTYAQMTAAHPDYVQVPGQLIRPDCVHEIPNGAKILIGESGEPTGDVTLNGKLVAHYDACSEAAASTRHSASPASNSNTGHVPSFNGWVEDSQEELSLGSSDNIAYEAGEWYVPNNPSVNGGLIYLFNGIAPTAQNWILQPVLQYGVGYAGGGNYWAMASWLVGPSYVFHSPLARVNSGNTLFGYTEQTGSGGTLDYFTEAYDLSTGAYSWISIESSGLHWTVAYQGVLEVYGVNTCSMLPSTGYAYFFDNYVDHNYPNFNAVSPAFYGDVFQSGCSDWAYVYDGPVPNDYSILFY
jgi:hypothetical protein